MYPATRIPFRVQQCSMYEDKRLPDFAQMCKIAWQIRSRSAGHEAGFILLSDVAKPQTQDQEEPKGTQEIPAAASENE